MKDLQIVHIIGIGGCASSAIAELLQKHGVKVSGSDMADKKEFEYYRNLGISIKIGHERGYVYQVGVPDLVLYTPAIISMNPHNPEILEAQEKGLPIKSWEHFLGEYLDTLEIPGFTVSGSEGKGTTAGILTSILQKTEFDPLSILGAKLKTTISAESNIYQGEGKSFVLEADEYNRNFHAYKPSTNCMINFEYEHPETYANFEEYKKAFIQFFSSMKNPKNLIFRITATTVQLAQEYNIHNVIWVGTEETWLKWKPKGKVYFLEEHQVDKKGNSFILRLGHERWPFRVNALPSYMAWNASGAIIAALEAGLAVQQIQENLLRFKGMVRRFDLFYADENRVMISDYGHSPNAINYITKEIRSIFPNKKLHMVFQPHLFSRTFNFFNEFVEELAASDKVSMLDIYPAREDSMLWEGKISSLMMADALKARGVDAEYRGHCSEIVKNLKTHIGQDEITCFMGAGDMDVYYPELFALFNAKN